MRVLIENSATGQPSTSMKHAKNHVKRSRADWVKTAAVPTIRFRPGPHQRAVKKCARKWPGEKGHFYQAGLDKLAEPYQLRGAGTVGEIKQAYHLGFLGKWPWTAAVLHKPLQNISNNEPPEVRTAIMRARYAR